MLNRQNKGDNYFKDRNENHEVTGSKIPNKAIRQYWLLSTAGVCVYAVNFK